MNINRLAVDISGDFDQVDSLQALWGAGVRCIIHKASEGVTIQDSAYAKRRQDVVGAGFLWSAYHFGRGTPVADQVDNFLKVAQPDDTTPLWLDWEVASMTLNQAEDFLGLCDQKVGRATGIYSYVAFLKENLPPTPGLVFTNRPLWIAAYPNDATPPTMPAFGFDRYLFWQYSDGVSGPQPHACAGLSGSVDSNHFDGSEADLRSLWDLWMQTGNINQPVQSLTQHAVAPPVVGGVDQRLVANRKLIFDAVRPMVTGASLRQSQVDQINSVLNTWVPDGSSRKNLFAVVRDMVPKGVYTQTQVNTLDSVLTLWEKSVGFVG